MPRPRVSEIENILSADELDIDARLRSYSRKISSLRSAEAPATPLGAMAKRRQRALDSSVADDYHRAVRTQRCLQVLTAVQIATILLIGAALFRGPLLTLCLFVFGDACGLAGSFVSVQVALHLELKTSPASPASRANACQRQDLNCALRSASHHAVSWSWVRPPPSHRRELLTPGLNILQTEPEPEPQPEPEPRP